MREKARGYELISALISDSKRVFSNQRLNKTQGADRATVQRLAYNPNKKVINCNILTTLGNIIQKNP